MGYRKDPFSPGEVYHLTVRGVEQRQIFQDDTDRRRLRLLLPFCGLPEQRVNLSAVLRHARRRGENVRMPRLLPGRRLLALLCYCFMPNHLHFLVREEVARGISRYMQRLLNSYARYFNVRYERSGPLFAGPFHSVHVEDDEQLLHVSRYIHLNPYVAGLVDDPLAYPWSSLGEYIGSPVVQPVCDTELIHSLLSPPAYRRFVLSYAASARGRAAREKELAHRVQARIRRQTSKRF